MKLLQIIRDWLRDNLLGDYRRLCHGEYYGQLSEEEYQELLQFIDDLKSKHNNQIRKAS